MAKSSEHRGEWEEWQAKIVRVIPILIVNPALYAYMWSEIDLDQQGWLVPTCEG